MNQQNSAIKSPIPHSPIHPNRLPLRPPLTDEVRDQSIRPYANHFECKIDDNVPLYQYNVNVSTTKVATGRTTLINNPYQRDKVMRDVFPDDCLDGSIYIWYDPYENKLYSREKLETPRDFNKNNNNEEIYRVVISELVAEFSTHEIHQFINGEQEIYPSETVRILELLLRQSLGRKIRVVSKKYYFVGVPPRDAQGGLEQREGFIGALHLHSRLITWNVQRKDTYFYAGIPLQEFIRREIGGDRIPSEDEVERIQTKLAGCKIITRQRTDRSVYTFHQFIRSRPNEIIMKDQLTVEEYYRQKFRISLQHLDHPCVQAYATTNNNESENQPYLIPVELCRIQEWQIYRKNTQETTEIQRNRLEPVGRYGTIMDIVYQCDFNRSQLCRNIGFSIDTREIITVDAHVLRRPRINVGSNNEADVSLGKILLRGRLFAPRPIRDLPIIFFGSNFDDNRKEIDKFQSELVEAMGRVEMYDGHTITEIVQTDRSSISEHLKSLKDQGHRLVLCIVERNVETQSDRLIANIKDLAATEHGLMTQLVELTNVANTDDLPTYCDNVVQQLNNKNAGLNTQVELDEAIKSFTDEIDNYMFFGADTINTKCATRANPSYAAIVGSRDPMCSRSVNRISRQYPRQGACAIETIFAMKTMVTQLMRFYSGHTTNLPNKVVFYRHGIDKDDFSKILDYEIPLITEAFDEIYGAKENHPKLTYIVVQRHHHTRFFMYDRDTDETRNVEKGTVIDRTIVHPYHHDFYLNSHVATSGVNHPSLYHVIRNEIELTDEELHLLTYHLAFADPRSNATEAMPCVVHQAHKTTQKVQETYGKLAEQATPPVSPLENPTIDDIEYELLDISNNLQHQLLFA